MASIRSFHEADPALTGIFTELNSLDVPSLLVLRGHLLIEVLLRRFLDARTKNPRALTDAKLSFVQVLCIARAQFDDDTAAYLWDYIGRVNRIRNTLAHNLHTQRFDSEWRAFIADFVADFPSHAAADESQTLKRLLIDIASNLAHITEFDV